MVATICSGYGDEKWSYPDDTTRGKLARLVRCAAGSLRGAASSACLPVSTAGLRIVSRGYGPSLSAQGGVPVAAHDHLPDLCTERAVRRRETTAWLHTVCVRATGDRSVAQRQIHFRVPVDQLHRNWPADCFVGLEHLAQPATQQISLHPRRRFGNRHRLGALTPSD